MEACDLHVGAQLMVLGRKLTLKQTADLETAEWHAREATRLGREQERLLGELRAYGREVGALPSGKHACGFDGGRSRLNCAVDHAPTASQSLRLLMRDNDFLRGHLRAYFGEGG